MLQGTGLAALPAFAPDAVAAPAPHEWPILESADTPKICLSPADAGRPLGLTTPPAPTPGRGSGGFGGYLAPKQDPSPDPAATTPAANLITSYRRIRQLGVNHILNAPIAGGLPWTEDSIRAAVGSARNEGMVAYNAYLPLPRSILFATSSRSRDMEQAIASIQAAGKGGIPVVEYNFYSHRAVEGYYETVGRAGAGYTAFNNDLELLIDENSVVVQPIYRDEAGQITQETLARFPKARRVKFKDLPPLANETVHSLDEMWANIAYFLKAAAPSAEKAGVRLALHPNDPPSPLSRGSQQIMGTLDGWKHLITLVDSPANGITFDCGVTRELGEDPVAAAAYFASRRRINHAHYRNVRVRKPRELYEEVFIDEGQVRMFSVMKELVKHKYTGAIYPEHPRALDADRERHGPGGRIPGYPGGGGYTGIAYSVAYTRAMIQAALESV